MSSDPSSVSSTTEIACRQSYTILTTDGFWNENFTGPGNADGSTGTTVTGPNGQSYAYSPSDPYQDSFSDTLADVAMKYWETDLRPATVNEVPPSTEDPAFWQHMTTFTMGLGFTPIGISPSGTTIPQIFSWANGGTAINNFSWPKPAPNSIYNIADLAHAGVNGHGGFYSATSPAAFSSGLADALKRASERVGTGASLAANSTQLNNGTVAYQANYYTAKWKGDLKAFAINSSTGAISIAPTWSVANTLKASDSSSRNIWTYNPTAAAGSQFVVFQNGSSAPPALSSTELTALGSSATTQMQIVNYLRGDNTLEQKNTGSYRNRDAPLGDIVDSQPVYSGPPSPNEFESEAFAGINATSTSADPFQDWAVGTTDTSGNPVPSAASQRTALVFVAANDGMLHAFNASTGAEVFAYLPGAVINAGVANLANTSYGSASVPHQYYNDGELTVADVYITLPGATSPSWRTVLVGSTGRGPGEAVYALDVTDPGQITPLWERSANDGNTSDGNSKYIGQMVGKPVIAQVADGNWQVLIGNGYNSASNTAALLEFNLVNGTLSVHAAGTSLSNGLAAPVAWMDTPTNGISTEAYAGDLLGGVWSFPLATITTTKGNNAVTTITADLTTAGSKVFSASDSSGTAQPITAGMTAGRDPSTGYVWLFFGTGRYLSSSDLAIKNVQSWYGVIAQGGPTLPITRSQLVQREIIYEQDGDPTATPPTLGARVVSSPTSGDMLGKGGWYIDLEQPITDSAGNVTGGNALGERMVTPNQFQGNLLLGTTRIPVVTDICNPSGSGWVMAINPFTGTNPTANFFIGNGSGGSVTLPNGKTAPAAGVGFSSLPNSPVFVGGDMLMSFDNGTTSSLSTSSSTGGLKRVSWQELVNP